MAKYHVNREGNPGLCKARKACPFGDLNDDHFPTAAEATKYYEKIADPIHKASLSDAQLSAFRRNGDFHMRDGDDELLAKMESEEDNREAGNRKYERFSALDFERMAEIADAKIQYFDGESGAPLDRYTRGVVNRLISVRTTARFAARAIKES